MSVFGAVISQLSLEAPDHFGPVSFKSYGEQQGFKGGATPQYISVDSLERLNRELYEAGCMVLRLGRASDKGTQFAVVRIPEKSPEVFFLVDKDIFPDRPIQTFVPEASARDLFPYSLINKRNERSATNLGFASGLFAEALELDRPHPSTVPAGGNSTYTFSFLVDDDYETELVHNDGQVEIDCLFVAKRGGRDTVFVLEAKSGAFSSLAKHKLVYPVLGILPKVPEDFEVVPVYVRIQHDGASLTYNVAECKPLSATPTRTLTSLSVRSARRLRLWTF